MTLDTFVAMFKLPFPWREFLVQFWFVARVSMLPALLMTLPYSVILTFITNILLTDIGAGDFSGMGAALFTVTQIGPMVTVLVISGAASTAMCADLGARTIREELDALRVMGIDPIRALVVPRVLAATVVGLLEVQLVSTVSLVGAFFFTVYVQHVSAGAFVAGLPVLTHFGDVVVSSIKGALFGGVAGLIAGYKGISVGGGPAGVGNAVNETVVFVFMVLFTLNVIVTAVGSAINLSMSEPTTPTVPSALRPRVQQVMNVVAAGWNRIGSQTRFYATTIGAIPDAVINYRGELLRLIAQMGMGVAALAMIGGTVVIVGFITIMTGALVAVQGYKELASVGVDALTGFASAYFNVRLIVPGTASVALSATIGAGATAQIGAMRINEEIDALEVIGIRSIAYLASTPGCRRGCRGDSAVLRVHDDGVLSARTGTLMYGQGSGVYDHYFNTFLSPRDIIWSFFQVVAIMVVLMLVHTYYGYTAHGGPAGVGEAVGRAVRTTLAVAAIEIVMITLAIYGRSGNFHLAS